MNREWKEPQGEGILLELVVFVGNHQQELRHQQPDEEANAHKNQEAGCTLLMEEIEPPSN